MRDREQEAGTLGLSALFVTTVPITLEVFLIPFARHFRREGWRVDALANGASGDPALQGEFDTLFDVAWSRNPLSPSNLIGTARRVKRLVADGGYDVVHVHTPIAAFVTRFALRKRRRGASPTVIYTAHGFHFFTGQRPLPHALFRTLERVAAGWTDYLVTINAEDYAAARRFGRIPSERVRLIPGIGVDIGRFSAGSVSDAERSAVREGLAVGPGQFMLTMVAEFAPVKRHEHILRAMAEVKDPDVVLVLVGEGPLIAAVSEMASSLGVTDRVRFAGYRRDIPAILAASDALTLVSAREGLARSVLEAMASGIAVIGTRTRGIADAVGEDAGWIVPIDDASALAAAIDEAAGDREETRRRGVAGRDRVSREFSLDRIIAEYEELYREATASSV